MTSHFATRPELKTWTKFVAEKYLEINPEERSVLGPLFSAIEGDSDLASRKTMPLHVTSSAIVVDEQLEHLLLIHNRALNMWVQPGGHLEPGELPTEAAKRELQEECGLTRPILLSSEPNLGLPLDIDIHRIPVNRNKCEEEHLHCDFRFLFRSIRSEPILSDESWSAAWVPFGDELFQLTGPRMVQVLSKLQRRLPLNWRSRRSMEKLLHQA